MTVLMFALMLGGAIILSIISFMAGAIWEFGAREEEDMNRWYPNNSWHKS